jgi:hypothetical protein
MKEFSGCKRWVGLVGMTQAVVNLVRKSDADGAQVRCIVPEDLDEVPYILSRIIAARQCAIAEEKNDTPQVRDCTYGL